MKLPQNRKQMPNSKIKPEIFRFLNRFASIVLQNESIKLF
ncbi:hypothetical protein LEP1GSC137_0892 [Leptospira borgpetersenii str. Noumea 25]|uniref:Uncharacterized protein n=1 Tax=Leptospira borgpetersenii serovar Ballum TaxID=280505 RepID=A0A0S2IRH6_LEPBO|nr:hypothetical protein LBBP_01976 [Leptospira borgpetersenii serovar Ballum]EKR02008.1 hypothetical protein LEP1GSC121_3918 [Leptospira borgpetersenii serovar Castellonis str. 200801910]EMO12032.1 hypothetical protein LEP1GSC137_0892 [Leptospira borgpetersenii str. Noumea 25]